MIFLLSLLWIIPRCNRAPKEVAQLGWPHHFTAVCGGGSAAAVAAVIRLGIEEPTWEEFYGENVEEAKPFDEFFTKGNEDDEDLFLAPGYNGVSDEAYITPQPIDAVSTMWQPLHASATSAVQACSGDSHENGRACC